MIIGKWEEPFLQAAVESSVGLCDEFIFIDTAPGNNPNRKFLNIFQNRMNYVFEDLTFDKLAPKDPPIVKIIDMPRGEDKDFSFAEARELARTNTESEWVLRLDADEVLHEKDITSLKTATEDNRFDVIEVAFYHFMVYPWLYQYIEPKTILLRTNNFSWINGVHEVPNFSGRVRKLHEIKYYHYGYCRGQEEVFKRWQLYAEIDGRPPWYKGQNPATILEGRISICQNFQGEHPKVVQGVLEQMFRDVNLFQVKEIPRYSMTDNYVGLLLITYNDEENLEQMLPTLEATLDYPTIVHVIDMGSTDCSVKIIADWYELQTNSNLMDLSIDRRHKLESLSKTMNSGFKYLMSRQECNYIGWIHPDMEFKTGWLSQLVSVLNVYINIGKICSWNTRCPLPDTIEPISGHEQCYIVRRGVLLKIGLFDERFIGIGGFEDLDLNRRILIEGWKVALAPTSLVYHSGMQTRSKRDTSAEQIYNRQWYQTKWGDTKDGEMFI